MTSQTPPDRLHRSSNDLLSATSFLSGANAAFVESLPTTECLAYNWLCSIALYPRCVKLFFAQGALLSKSDPNKLLQGSGKTVRHVVLNSAADFDRAEIEVLMAAALKLAKLRLDASAKGSVIIRAEAQATLCRLPGWSQAKRTSGKSLLAMAICAPRDSSRRQLPLPAPRLT
jgi:hypothetical protein